MAFLSDYSQYLLLATGHTISTGALLYYGKKLGIQKKRDIIYMSLLFLVVGFFSTVGFAGFESAITGNFSWGMSSMGACLIGAPILLLVAKIMKLDSKSLMDLYALYAPAVFIFMRISCITYGCCGGIVLFGHFRWPAREVEILFWILIGLLLFRIMKKPSISGQLLPIIMMAYGAFRFVNEWLRTATVLPSGLHIAHIWSILCCIIGCSIYFELRSKQYKPNQNRGRKHHA